MEAGYLKLEGEYNKLYRQAVGTLLYVAAIGILCTRVSTSRQGDWNTRKRVMKYLKQTISFKLMISADHDLDLVGYVDSDWGGDIRDRKSTSGFFYQLGQSPISRSSKKQVSVVLSSTEAKYVSAAYASQEAIWLRQLLDDLGVAAIQPTLMYEDNQGCNKLAASEKMNARTKHTDIRYHHLRHLVDHGVVKFAYCETDRMVADALTKPLP